MLRIEEADSRNQAAEVPGMPGDRPQIRWNARMQEMLDQGAIEADHLWSVQKMPAAMRERILEVLRLPARGGDMASGVASVSSLPADICLAGVSKMHAKAQAAQGWVCIRLSPLR
jgi:hypothetical protein